MTPTASTVVPPAPQPRRHTTGGLVCAVDHLAASAGAALLRAGGSAVDAAVGASAVLAVTSQHLCGMGGDLIAVVAAPGADPAALEAAGPAGAGAAAAADALRAEGHRRPPLRGDVRSVTVPGCVDGWLALHDRHGRLPLAEVLAPAVDAAAGGFPVGPTLAASLPRIAGLAGADDYLGASAGSVVRRPGLATALRAIAAGGRDPWYGGAFGAGLLRLGGGLFSPADLASPVARWRPAVAADALGARLWSAPPVSQGYLIAAAAVIADRVGLPADPDDPRWAHVLLEASRAAGTDRLAVLHDGADGAALLDPGRLAALAEGLSADRAAAPARAAAEAWRPGDTTAVVAVDETRMGVALVQSNASGFGAHIAVPEVGVWLHDRGIGFSLDPASPAAMAPGRRPPHTLSPLVATGPDGALRLVAGTMGGDAQPQILLQVAARALLAGVDPADAVAAGRVQLTSATPGGSHAGFDTWDGDGRVRVAVEGHCPPGWADALAALGHDVVVEPAWSGGFGHAHAVTVGPGGATVAGGSDPRALTGAVVAG
ncbi:MAG TPA: gamma-glutamyltransferase [Acidimicrobiales bacterium]|nr:gamma-glutamyltransferase [Acidimicrobiales bacterium]